MKGTHLFSWLKLSANANDDLSLSISISELFLKTQFKVITQVNFGFVSGLAFKLIKNFISKKKCNGITDLQRGW